MSESAQFTVTLTCWPSPSGGWMPATVDGRSHADNGRMFIGRQTANGDIELRSIEPIPQSSLTYEYRMPAAFSLEE